MFLSFFLNVNNNKFPIFLLISGMYVNDGEGYGALIRGGTIQRQDMRHLFRGDNRKGITKWTSIWYSAKLQSYFLFAMHSEVASGEKFW